MSVESLDLDQGAFIFDFIPVQTKHGKNSDGNIHRLDEDDRCSTDGVEDAGCGVELGSEDATELESAPCGTEVIITHWTTLHIGEDSSHRFGTVTVEEAIQANQASQDAMESDDSNSADATFLDEDGTATTPIRPNRRRLVLQVEAVLSR